MSFIEKLHKASFRDIPFLVQSESVSRGNKTVIHEYPNSNIRFVETLGKLPPTFNIRALIHGSGAFNNRFILEEALEREGIGLLVHPIYGKLNVKVLDFTVDSSQAAVGEFIFNINFSQSRENITPSSFVTTNTAVSDKALGVREALGNKLEKVYKRPSNIFNYNNAIETVSTVLKNVRDHVNSVVNLSSKGAAAFNKAYRTLTNNITAIISSGTILKENLNLYFDLALDSAVFIDQLDTAWERLVQVPRSEIGYTKTSYDIENQQNKSAVEEYARLNSLVNTFESKIFTDYTTDTDLVNARSFLDTHYRLFFNNENEIITDNGLESLAEDPDVRRTFLDLRVTARTIFDEKEKAIFRVSEIFPGKSSLAMTAFRYYGNLSLVDKLIGLNPSVNHAHFNKGIQCLSK